MHLHIIGITAYFILEYFLNTILLLWEFVSTIKILKDKISDQYLVLGDYEGNINEI